jgi:hydroxypyruvate reductase
VELELARADVDAIFQEVLRALDPAALVQKSVSVDGRVVHAGDARYEIPADGRIVVLGAGKSAVGMARGVEAVFGDRLANGLVVTKRGLGGDVHGLGRTEVRESSHPVPDETSVTAGEELLRRAHSLEEDDLAIVVISGGGSALIEAPIDGISLDDFKTTTERLLKAGADISTLNAVRRRLSRIKAGGLARAIAPAKVINLILSDVLGNPFNVIASGPTVVPDMNDRGYIDELRSRDVWKSLPRAVQQALEKETTDEPISNVLTSVVIGDAPAAATAAVDAARERGYKPFALGAEFSGEAREFARFWAGLARATVRGHSSIERPACLIGAGETTVTVGGDGIGGRNTEMAAAAALEIDGVDGIAIASLATDGDDGVSAAAGGVVVGDSAARVRKAGLDPSELLAQNDTRAFLEAADALIVTGQTGINVNDLYLALIV